MKSIDMTQIYMEYSNKWVALDEKNHVISFGDSLDEVLVKAAKKGFDEPIVSFIPDPSYPIAL